VPLRSAGRRVGVLRVLADGELSTADVRLIETCAAVITGALADEAGERYGDMARGVLDGEAERAEIAAALHEGPVAALIAARYALDSGADAPAVRAVLSHALHELRGVVTSQRVRGIDGDLPGALRQLARDLRAVGVRVEVGVLDLAPGSVPSICSVAAYRVVAATLNGVTGPVTVVVDGGVPGQLRVTVTGADDMVDAGALDRWARRVAALDGELERHPDGVTLHLPSRLPVASTSGAAR
jgi:hypothetical protein